jgi:hypothetical protein
MKNSIFTHHGTYYDRYLNASLLKGKIYVRDCDAAFSVLSAPGRQLRREHSVMHQKNNVITLVRRRSE